MADPYEQHDKGPTQVMNMADQIHAEVRLMIGQSRLTRNSQGIALVHRHELQVFETLGRGAFSEVHEVKIVHGSAKGQSPNNISYAMKHLKARLLSQPDNFRLAAAELAIEAHMLASFDHPNIMKIRGWAANGVASFTDGRHDSFFLLLDKLDETLDDRINTWQRVMCHEQKQIQEMEQIFLQAQQKQLPQTPNSGGSNLVSDLWRRLSITNSSHQNRPTTGGNSSSQHHQQLENDDPIRIHQQQQQQQQQQQHQFNETIQQHHVAMQQLKQQQQHRAESLLLEKFGICVEIASAIAYLHECGVIFRDLKPSNIGFLNGRVQLFDFGLSRELPTMNLTEPFEMSGKVGTLRYMAVEVACHSEYNVSADVYSWSMVCYEIFTLIKPFAGWTRDMHSNLVCGRGVRPEFNTPDPSTSHHPPVQPAVKQLLEICWHQHAHRRPTMQSAEQQMKHLEEQQLFIVCALDRTKMRATASQSFNMKHHTLSSNVVSSQHPSYVQHQQYQSQLRQQQLQQQQQFLQQHQQQQQQQQHSQMITNQLSFQSSSHQQQFQSAPTTYGPHVVELPCDFTVEKQKPSRNHSETYCTSATTMSSASCDSVDVAMHIG